MNSVSSTLLNKLSVYSIQTAFIFKSLITSVCSLSVNDEFDEEVLEEISVRLLLITLEVTSLEDSIYEGICSNEFVLSVE